jgi:hypothetical protein
VESIKELRAVLICDVIFNLVLDVVENNMVMQHLLVDLKQVVGRQKYSIGRITKWACALDTSNEVPTIEQWSWDVLKMHT